MNEVVSVSLVCIPSQIRAENSEQSSPAPIKVVPVVPICSGPCMVAMS
jgi:hypothetical protein